MTCPRQEIIISEFNLLENWEDKYEYIIDLGKELPAPTSDLKKDKYLIKGCASKAWINYKMSNHNIIFMADAEAIISKGLIALMIEVFNNLPPKQIIEKDVYFIDKIGLDINLSPNRANGLTKMIESIKKIALIELNNG